LTKLLFIFVKLCQAVGLITLAELLALSFIYLELWEKVLLVTRAQEVEVSLCFFNGDAELNNFKFLFLLNVSNLLLF